MWMMLLSAAVWAAPIGNPVPFVDAGRFAVGTRLEMVSQWMSVQGCQGGSCDGVWRHNSYVASGRVTIVDGLGLDVEVGRLTDKISQANYSGTGVQWALGMRGGVPLAGSWWLSGRLRYGGGVANNGLDDLEFSESRYNIGTGSALLAWSPRYDVGVTFWGGAQSAWRWMHTVSPLGVQDGEPILQFQTEAGFPVSGVLGISVISEPLGVPWQPPWRLGVELEGMLGQTNLTAIQILLYF